MRGRKGIFFCFGFDAALIWKYNKPATEVLSGQINEAETHLQDAVVCPFGIHDGGVSGEGPELQRQPHQLLVLVLHQVVLHVAAAAEGQRVAVWQGSKGRFQSETETKIKLKENKKMNQKAEVEDRTDAVK